MIPTSNNILFLFLLYKKTKINFNNSLVNYAKIKYFRYFFFYIILLSKKYKKYNCVFSFIMSFNKKDLIFKKKKFVFFKKKVFTKQNKKSIFNKIDFFKNCFYCVFNNKIILNKFYKKIIYNYFSKFFTILLPFNYIHNFFTEKQLFFKKYIFLVGCYKYNCVHLISFKTKKIISFFFGFYKYHSHLHFLSQINYLNSLFKFKFFCSKQIFIEKKTGFSLIHFLNYIIFINDNFFIKNFKNNCSFISNNFLKNYFNFFDLNSSKQSNFFFNKNINSFNNYYPVLTSNKIIKNFFYNNYKNNYDIDFVSFTNKFVINFLEKNLKKHIYVRYINNYYFPINNSFLKTIINEYKNFQPAFWKNFLVYDFINLLWYSFFLRDLSIISEWISIFMETLNFKNHKKFLNFFLNFVTKYSDVFVNILNIKGFFFDIRGKVGVTGSSKKRHFFFKFGSLNKSSKKYKINFNQNLVRTYSGVMGLTYIINY